MVKYPRTRTDVQYKSVKLSQYAKQLGISYKTVHRLFQRGELDAYQLPFTPAYPAAIKDVSEIAAGLNDNRPKLLKLLSDR